MTLDARNRIVPQMSEYDKIGDQWVPYLMRADGASKCFPSVNTDKWGMRNSIGRNGELITVDTLDGNKYLGKIGVVMGSSTVFGVGATQDGYTIPSYLNSETETSWLNFGGRAYNSTQELIRLMLHLPKKIDHLIVCSGVNNITLAFLSSSTSPVYNSLFSFSAFERAMSNAADEYIGVRHAWARLLKELRHRIYPQPKAEVRQSIRLSYQDVLNCFERDLRASKAIADGMGATLYFALQPLATWIDKALSAEETEIFNILDGMSNDWQVLAKQINDERDTYFADVASICERHAVQYCNINYVPEFKMDEWLFVDRVHLTNRGCELVAKTLKKEFNL